MVVAISGGLPAANAASQTCQRPCVSAWRSVAWRVAPTRNSTLPTGIAGPELTPNQSRHCGWPARAFTLASEPAATSGLDVQSGSDLNDMCTLQLGMMYQLLARAGTNYTSMRCAVYARNFTAVGPGQVKLVRVAQFPVVPGLHDDLLTQQQQSTLLLHTEQSWALQGGSAAVDPSAMIEDCLLHREVVALPSSSALVFPLVDGGVLVGLLVSELETEADEERERRRAADRDALAALGPGPGAAERQAELGVSQALLGACTGGAAASQQASVGQSLGRLERFGSGSWTLSPSAVDAAGDGDAGAGSAASTSSLDLRTGGRPRRSLTDEELQCLRLSVPLLAKACGMNARASWQLAQTSIGAAAARGLLREAQRPLSTLNTFSAMLIPRLKDGDPDKDMAKGILTQGKRLQDLMWQLEDALHGATVPGPQAGPALGGMVSNIPVVIPGGAAQPHPPVMATPPFRPTPSALPRDPSPAVQELLQLPPPRFAAALPDGSQAGREQSLQAAGPDAAQGASSGSATASMSDTAVAAAAIEGAEAATAGSSDSGPAAAAVSPGRVTFVDRGSRDSAPATLADSSLGAFTIRQPPVVAARRGPAGALGAGLHPGQGHSYAASGAPAAATATIDVEMDTCEPRVPEAGSGLAPAGLSRFGTASSERRLASHKQAALGAVPWQADSALSLGTNTNLASALAGVLTAAYRLAAVSGIGFIVNSPLSAVLPRRGNGASSGKARPAATAPAPAPGPAVHPASQAAGTHPEVESAAADGAAVGKPRLIPRPVRPLVVGVRPALVQRVVGYMLDIAVQCTPRGGQVCVSARQDGAGVQVQVLHSGRMDLHRLHAMSRSLMAPHVPATAAHGPAQAEAQGLVAAHTSAGALQGARATATAAEAVVRSGDLGAGATARAVAGVHGGGGSGVQAGSGVLSVELAQELAQQAGGYLTVSYPFNMVNAKSGSLDVGTSVEIWLPGPIAAAAGAH